MNREAAAVMSRARARLGLEEPFWGMLALETECEEAGPGEGIQTLAVTPKSKVLYCPEYVLAQTPPKLVGGNAHEVGHLAFDLFGRIGDRDHLLANIAHDIVVNLIIRKSCREGIMELPDGALIDDKYEGWHFERVYEDLLSKQKMGIPPPGGKSGSGHGTPGGCCNHKPGGEDKKDDGIWGPGGQAARAENSLAWRRRVAMAAEAARRIGRMPGHLEDLVRDILQPKLNAYEIVRRFFANATGTPADISWARPGRRSVALGRYLPSWKPRPEPIVLGVDSSGSTIGPPLDRFVAEAGGFLRQFPGVPTRLIVADAEIQADIRVTTAKQIRDAVVGGGGTNFADVFTLLKKGPKPRALVFLTDLEAAGIPPTPPPYPVLWIVPQGRHGKAPWGRVVEVPA